MDNKKYYGFMYQGIGNTTYDFKNGEDAFENPYEALIYANRKWDNTPDIHVKRLLTVLEVETMGANDSVRYAFFQFTCSKACQEFAKNKDNIAWSTHEDQIWNGDDHMMG